MGEGRGAERQSSAERVCVWLRWLCGLLLGCGCSAVAALWLLLLPADLSMGNHERR